MRFTLQLIVITVLGYGLALFLPWYSVAFAALIGGYFLRSSANFLAGFLAIGAVWLVKTWLITTAAPGIDLPTRVAKILTLPDANWLIAVTCIIGGLVGGFAALTGSYLKPAKKKWYEERA